MGKCTWTATFIVAVSVQPLVLSRKHKQYMEGRGEIGSKITWGCYQMRSVMISLALKKAVSWFGKKH